ncbi:MAG: SsrA-binding protein SmpB [Bacilli bacterium]|jgi:SsrA-binding protein
MEIKNRRVYYDYSIEETYEAGMVLKGTEIKSIRKGSVDLRDSYIHIKKQEAFIINMYIAKYEEGNQFNEEERRTRKLLLKKTEIRKLEEKTNVEGYTLVPIKIYFKNRRAKVLIGVALGKKTYDKREVIKQRDLAREARKEAKL